MKKVQKIYVMGRPICYYAFSLFFSIIFNIVFSEDKILGAALAASFFILFFLTVEKSFFVIIGLFFILGVFRFNFYFNIKIPRNIEVRIIQDKVYYKIAEYKNRTIILKGCSSNIEDGTIVKVEGKFKQKINFYRGTIGEYKVDRTNGIKKDYIYKLYDIKRHIYEKYKSTLGERNSSIIMALCFGEEKYLSSNEKDSLQELGIVHAISVSGFHLAIIYGILESIGGIPLAMIISVIYVVFTGIKAATLRSFIMILIMKLSKSFFKNYDSLSSLSLSAIILILFRPYYAVNAGFLLSISAVLGILIYNKKINKALYKLPNKIRESLSLSISSQIFSMPYIISLFNKVSLGSILGNFFMLPIYSFIVVLGNLGLICFKIDYIFKIISLILMGILYLNDIIEKVLLLITPPMLKLSTAYSFIYVGMFMWFLLMKKGHVRAKYIPAFLSVFLFLDIYKIFPEISYMNFGSKQVAIFRYKDKSILLADDDPNSKNMNIPFNIENKIKNIQNSKIFIKGKCVIEPFIQKGYSKENGPYSLTALNIYTKEKLIIFKNHTYDKDEKLENFSPCDIIEIENSYNFADYGKVTDTYILIGNNVYKIF